MRVWKKQLYFCLISSFALCSCGTDRRRWEKLILPFQAHDVLRVNIDEVNTEYSFESGHYQYFSNNPEFIKTVYQVVVTTPVISKKTFKNYKCEKFLSIYFELADGIYDRKCLASWGSYIFYKSLGLHRWPDEWRLMIYLPSVRYDRTLRWFGESARC